MKDAFTRDILQQWQKAEQARAYEQELRAQEYAYNQFVPSQYAPKKFK